MVFRNREARATRGLFRSANSSGGQSQFSTLFELSSDRTQVGLTYNWDSLHKPLTVPDFAEAAHLSPRQFSRAFHDEAGQSPTKTVENLRVEAAR